MREIRVASQGANVTIVTEFVDEYLESVDCPMKAQMQIDVAIDEIFSNVAKFAYGDGGGDVDIRIDVKEDPRTVELEFRDYGIPFNPLGTEDPDITLSVEERKIGGLGIFVVKKTMDEVDYQYANGQNVLRLRKQI